MIRNHGVFCLGRASIVLEETGGGDQWRNTYEQEESETNRIAAAYNGMNEKTEKRETPSGKEALRWISKT